MAPLVAAAGGPSSAAGLLALQRVAGNAPVARLFESGRHVRDDSGGHDQVVPRDTGQPDPVQRSAVHDVVRSAGRPLAGGLRAEMEARLGADFSDVRLHTDAAGHTAAESVRAEAFTSGSHIAFRHGGFDPSTVAGKHTLAHELTHVVQQRSGPVAGTDVGDGLRVSDPSDRYEREAEATATRVMAAPPEQVAAARTAGAHPSTGAGSARPVQRARGQAKAKAKAKAPAPAPPVESPYERLVRAVGERIEGFAKLLPNEQEDVLLAACGVVPDNVITIEVAENDLEEGVDNIKKEMTSSQYRPRYETGGGTSDWAAASITAEHTRLRNEPGNPWKNQTTLHHKISRRNLSTLFTAAAKADQAEVQPLYIFLDTLKDRVGSTSYQKLLWNMPANLEMGPASDTRRDDPNADFDRNIRDGRQNDPTLGCSVNGRPYDRSAGLGLEQDSRTPRGSRRGARADCQLPGDPLPTPAGPVEQGRRQIREDRVTRASRPSGHPGRALGAGPCDRLRGRPDRQGFSGITQE
ncbi:DUF4157 domain-containing protein [Frankia sp. Cj3]|uniref:eCIS core domain-containing protein n=1 Tax=Frankia sp. Cj3 TaxID=2880976 RepID=UPI00272E18A6|nr:DUF4157 domain-containing protein [Frankia sp. Cj3]